MQADSKESSLTLEALVESMVLGPLTVASGGEPNEPLKLIAMIKEGLSVQCLQQLAGRIPAEILSELLGRSESALSRLYSKRLNKLEADNIYDASLLWRELRLFFDDDRFLMGECLF